MKPTNKELIDRFPAIAECDLFKREGEFCNECIMYECIKVAQERSRVSKIEASKQEVLRMYMDIRYGNEYSIIDLLMTCAMLEVMISKLYDMMVVEKAKWN